MKTKLIAVATAVALTFGATGAYAACTPTHYLGKVDSSTDTSLEPKVNMVKAATEKVAVNLPQYDALCIAADIKAKTDATAATRIATSADGTSVGFGFVGKQWAVGGGYEQDIYGLPTKITIGYDATETISLGVHFRF